MKTSYLAVLRAFKGTGAALLLATWCTAGCGPAGTTAPFDPAPDEAAVRAVLARQQEAWNRGDVEAFMDGYARTDSLRFASGAAVQQGWQATLDRYHRTYPDRAAMGTLAFTLHDVRVLSPRWAVVFGAWQLERAEDQLSGLFTLLFEKRPEGWRIVADHTSSAAS